MVAIKPESSKNIFFQFKDSPISRFASFCEPYQATYKPTAKGPCNPCIFQNAFCFSNVDGEPEKIKDLDCLSKVQINVVDADNGNTYKYLVPIDTEIEDILNKDTTSKVFF